MIATSTTLTKVRALYERAHAGVHTRNAELIEEWRLVQDGQTGTFRVLRLGANYRELTALGPLAYENGMHNGTHWQQNRNGITFSFAGFHERDAVDARTWAAPELKDVRLIGESVPANAYVVEINPPGGRHEWLFIDKRSGTIVRRERIERRRRFVTTYDDYKSFDGVFEPSHVKTIDSLGNEREQTLLSRTLDLIPDARDVEMPPSRRTLVEFPPGITSVRLPVRFANGLLVARVTVAGHPYDFLLDSGAAGIVIDPAVADTLGLERYGGRVGATTGTFAETTAIVPLIAVGTLRMHNVVTRVVPVPFRADDRTRIAGLLGFDFFADTVVHVDPDEAQVTAIAPSAFRIPNDAVTVPIALDDKQPTARVHIGSLAARVILDTGANRTVLESEFADRSDLAPDRSTMVASRFRGVGGIGTAETVRIRQLEFAGQPFPDPLVDISTAALGVEDVDGVFGTDVLRGYDDIFFDYRASAVHVRRYKHAPPP